MRLKWITIISTSILLLMTLTFLLHPISTTLKEVQTVAEAPSTPNAVVYLPAVQNAGIAQATPTVDGISLPPNWQDTDPEHPDIEPEGTLPPEAFNTPIPYTLAPTPNLNTQTQSDLDRITFTNFRQLPLLPEQQNFYAFISWSPDSQHFLGFAPGKSKRSTGEEVDTANLYIGNTETGVLTLWDANGVWSSWSRDGQFIYYLSPRQQNGEFVISSEGSPLYDLYRRTVNTDQKDLILENITPPYVYQLPVVETSSEELLTLNTQHKPALMMWNIATAKAIIQGQQKPILTALAELVNQEQFVNDSLQNQREYYIVAPNGDLVAVIPENNPFYLVDIKNRSIVDKVNGTPHYAENIAWSPDSSKLAYATQQGVFLYDVNAKQSISLLGKQDLGFREGDNFSDFVSPHWISEKTILFSARSPDWKTNSGEANHDEYFILAIKTDLKSWKAISNYRLDTVSPNGKYAIVTERNPETGSEIKFLANITQ